MLEKIFSAAVKLALLLMPSLGLADRQSYDCGFHVKSLRSPLTKDLSVWIDRRRRTAGVWEAYSQQANDGFAPADLCVLRGDRVRLRRSLNGLSCRDWENRMIDGEKADFVMLMDPDNGEASLTGYTLEHTSRGIWQGQLPGR